MNSFRPEKLAALAVPHRVVRQIAEIHELRGRKALWARTRRRVLGALRKTAFVESVESSSRLENVTVARKAFDRIVRRSGKPEAGDRSQAELAGYRDALEWIHRSAATTTPDDGTLRLLHRKLMGHTPGGGGRYKTSPNEIVERRADGSIAVQLPTVSPTLTPDYVQALHDGFGRALDKGDVAPLLLVPLYVHDVLAIYPFADGNGRTARLTMVLLLHHLGFDVGRYVSLERLIESNKESYFGNLLRSDQGWMEEAHDPIPFVESTLDIVLRAYRTLEETATVELGRGTRARMVERAIDELPTVFRAADVHESCPLVDQDTVRNVMQRFKAEGRIAPNAIGRAATWRKLG